MQIGLIGGIGVAATVVCYRRLPAPVERLDAGARMIRDQGAEPVALAGADPNLAFDGQDPDCPMVDALDMRVDLLARLATGRALLPA